MLASCIDIDSPASRSILCAENRFAANTAGTLCTLHKLRVPSITMQCAVL